MLDKISKFSYILDRLINGFKVASLGGSFYSKTILLYFNFLPFLEKKCELFKYKERKIVIKKFGRKAVIYLNGFHDEYEILKEMLVNEEYKIEIQPKVIFDLGSNVGGALLYFSLKYPEAKIFGFEPDPVNFERLQKNIISLPNVKIFNMAVAGENGVRNFFVYPDKGISSSLTQRIEGQQPVSVITKNLDSLIIDLKLEKIDLLKIDVEGAEYEIFSSLKQKTKIGAIIGELHLDLMKASLEEFKQTLPNFKFEIAEANKEERLFFKAFNHEK
jgi:FkbM family methyltransferase